MVSHDLKKWFQPHPRPAKATPPPAAHQQHDRPTPAPPPLSEREQQVCEFFSQGSTFEAIARDLSCSPAAARAYHRRALSKRQRTIALASLEQSDGSTPSDRLALAKPEQALVEQPRDRRVSVRRERPSPLELLVPSLFVTGESVTTGQKLSTQRSHSPQMTTTDLPRPRLRKRSSRRTRAGWGWRSHGCCKLSVGLAVVGLVKGDR